MTKTKGQAATHTTEAMGNGIGYRSGFSLPEIIVVILIIGILALIGIGFGSRQINRTRISRTESDLGTIARSMEEAIANLGLLDESSDTDAINHYFDQWDQNFISCKIDLSSITYVPYDNQFGAQYCGAILNTAQNTDPWGTEMRIYYMIPANGTDYRFIVASAGPNRTFADDAETGYLGMKQEDDIFMLMTPRG